MSTMIPALKDRAVLLGWIAGLALAASLLWSLSGNFRSACLMRAANKALAAIENERVLAAPVFRPFTRHAPIGAWYSLTETDTLFFVFAVMRDGILVPCGVEISGEGKAGRIVPLGSHARQVIERVPEGVMQLYVRRIESAAAMGIREE